MPRHPGVGAAAGLLVGDLKLEKQATLWTPLEPGEPVLQLHQAYRQLASDVRAQLAADTDTGAGGADIALRFWAECRYVGQGYELLVDVPAPPSKKGTEKTEEAETAETEHWIREVEQRFDAAHESVFQRHFPDKPKMVVNAGCEASLPVAPLAYSPLESARDPEGFPANAVLERRAVCFLAPERAGDITVVDTPFIDRSQLLAGHHLDGPAVIEQIDSTTVLPPGFRATVDELGNLIIESDRAHEEKK